MPLSEQSEESRPSLPLPYLADSVRKAKRNSLKYIKDPGVSTPKDELHFIREITGGKSEESKEVRKNLFTSPPSASSVENTVRAKIETGEEPTDRKSGRKEKKESVPFTQNADEKSRVGYTGSMRRGSSSKGETAISNPTSPSSDLGDRLGSTIVSNTLPPESEEKTEVEPLPYDGPGFEETNEADDAGASQLGRANDQFDMKEMRRLSYNIPTSHSFSSANSLQRSSSYQLHFGNDDEILPDDDFLNDWDE